MFSAADSEGVPAMSNERRNALRFERMIGAGDVS
jgi:hypothetical protein